MYTGTYINPGNSSFERAINEDIFIDKSDLIKYCNDRINKKNCFICSTRPRRFGKTMAIDMLVAYYSKGCNSKELFEGLSVNEYDNNKKKDVELNKKFIENMNAYDVIRIDMQWVLSKVTDVHSIVNYIQNEVVAELKKTYEDNIDEKRDLTDNLLNIRIQTGKRFVILIDEWDAVFRFCKDDEEVQENYMKFLRSLFKGQGADEFVALAYITGILPIKKYGTESALNNFMEFTMVDPANIVEYMGFTENEVKGLCDEYHMDFEEMKNWYDGYTLCGKHIYSPNSVCTAITRNDIKSYWVSTDTYESLKVYISLNFEGLRDDIVYMIAGGRCKADVGMFNNDLISFASKDEVFACLVHLGYLAYDSKTEEVFIPNREVRTVFERAVKKAEWKEVIDAINESEKLMKHTLAKNSDEVARIISSVHANATSINKYNDENSLSCAITLAYYSAIKDYKLIRELPSGVGYADVVFLPRSGVVDKPVLVVELKCDKTAETALDQIKDRKYGEYLKDYSGKILLVGVNYDKGDKNKVHTCVIEEIVK